MLIAAERLRSQAESIQQEASADYIGFDFRVLLGPGHEFHLPSEHYWNSTPHPELDASSIVINIEDDRIEVEDASNFPDAGYLFFESAGDVGCYSYTSHDSRIFYGVRPVRKANLTIGATVSAFYEITDKLADPITLNGSFSERVFSWTADITVEALPFLEDTEFSVVVLRRKLVGTSSGIVHRAWHLWFYGWLLKVEYEENWEVKRNRLEVGGFLELLRRMELPPLFSASASLAAESSVTASSTLSNLSLESNSDDYVRGTPLSVEPGQVVDGDINTLWISQNEPTFLSYLTPGPDAPSVIDEVYAWPTLSEGEDATWFRIWIGYTSSLHGVRIVNEQTVWERRESDDYGWHPVANYIDLNLWEGRNTSYARKPIVFCKNRQVFDRYWDAGDAVVIEWSRLAYSRDFRMNPTQGFLHARTSGAGWNSSCVWGPSTNQNTPGICHWVAWTGPWIEPPSQRGWSLRTHPPHVNWRVAANWVVEQYPNPQGLFGRGGDLQNEEWIQITLPSLDFTLGQSLAADAADPASSEIIIKRNGDPDASLLDASGILLVDNELIAYSQKTETSVKGISRGYGGTQIAAHVSETKVYPFENGSAVNVPKISRISFLRPEEMNPKIFLAKLHLTSVENPRSFGSDGWGVDWGYSPVRTWNSIGPMEFTHPGVRAKGIFLRIQQMGGLIGQLAYDIPKSTRQLVITSTPYINKVEPANGYIYLGGERKPYSSLSSSSITLSQNAGPLPAGTPIYHLGGRARLNEVEIFSSTQEVEGNEEPIPSNDIVDLIVWIFTKKFNYDQNRIIRPSVTITGPTKIYFTRGNAIEILSELCEDYALRIVEYPDGSLEIISESELSRKNISIFWSNSLIRSIRSTGSPVQRVSQVVLKLRDPVTNDVRTFFYPDDPRSTGSPVEVERTAPLEYGPLLAQIAFYDEAGREGYEITAKGALDYVWGGQVHSLVDGTLSVVSNVYLTEGSELSAAVELEAI